jgi:hypothetical protein
VGLEDAAPIQARPKGTGDAEVNGGIFERKGFSPIKWPRKVPARPFADLGSRALGCMLS